MRRRRDGALALAAALLLTSCSSSSIEPARHLFAADDAEHGMELWISDGTEAGTSLIADLEAGPAGSFPSSVLRAGDLWYFTLGNPAFQIWKTDGTTEGTARVVELPRPSRVPDGETAGVELAMTSGRRLFFTFYDATYGRELWATTGTEGSTRIVADLTPGAASTPIRSWRMAVFEGRLFFAVEQGSYVSLIRSDGTEAGTSEIFRFGDDLMPKNVGRTLLLAAPHDLLRTDGTPTGTELGASINRSRTLFLDQIAIAGGAAYFPVHSTNGVHHSLWRSDGTAGGTVVVKDFGTAIVPLSPASHGTRAFFWVSRIVGDGLPAVSELWTSDGTEDGTVPLSPLPEGILAAFVDTRDHLFFEMWDTVSRPPVYALWASDGTEAGTHLLERFVRLERKENVGGTLMFLGRAIEPDSDYGLWRSDGTREGTRLIRAFRQP